MYAYILAQSESSYWHLNVRLWSLPRMYGIPFPVLSVRMTGLSAALRVPKISLTNQQSEFPVTRCVFVVAT